MLQLTLSKWVSGLLLPPMSLLLLIVVGLWVARRRRWGLYLVAASTVSLGFMSTGWLGGRLLHAMETVSALQPPYADQAQAIVVLGGGGEDWAPEWGSPSVSHLALERLQYAAWLHRQTGLPLLVTGGAPASKLAEGPVMALVLKRDFGVSARWIDDQALDTRGNAEHSARLLRPAGIRRIYVVSQAWHLPRAIPQFERFGFSAIAAPTAFTGTPRLSVFSVLPTGVGLQKSYLACHEALGRLAYALRDAIGGHDAAKR